MKKVGILGSGAVGITLANGLSKIGYEVTIGNRKGNTVDKWDGTVGTYSEVSSDCELIILAVKGTAAESVIESVKDNLAGKTIIDTTNPISDKPADEGVLNYFTSLDESLMERLQVIAPNANFVKAFNSVGNAFMVNPNFKDGKPTMFICGNDEKAKNEVSKILIDIGWESEDMGGVKSARAIEPLCILWCIPGFIKNDWSHALRVLRP